MTFKQQSLVYLAGLAAGADSQPGEPVSIPEGLDPDAAAEYRAGFEAGQVDPWDTLDPVSVEADSVGFFPRGSV